MLFWCQMQYSNSEVASSAVSIAEMRRSSSVMEGSGSRWSRAIVGVVLGGGGVDGVVCAECERGG